MRFSPSDLVSEFDAFLESIPSSYWRNETIATGGPATPLVAAWLDALTPDRAAGLREGLISRLRGSDAREIDQVLEVAEVWRDQHLLTAIVHEARRRYEAEAIGEDPVQMNRRLPSMVGKVPVPAGVAYLRELAARLSAVTRPRERVTCARAAVALCRIDRQPVSCLAPIIGVVRGWRDPPVASSALFHIPLLFASRREKWAVAALLRPEERPWVFESDDVRWAALAGGIDALLRGLWRRAGPR